MIPFRSRLEVLLEQNRQLLLRLFRDAERGEAKAARYAPWLQSLTRSGLLAGRVILGEGLIPQSQAPQEGGTDVGLYYQAALSVEKGLGAVLWDNDEYYQLSRVPDGLEASARLHFTPFSRCPPLVRQWLLPQVDVLVARLLELLQLEIAATCMWHEELFQGDRR